MSLNEAARWADRRTMTRGKVIENDLPVIPVEALREQFEYERSSTTSPTVALVFARLLAELEGL